jgi:hypothetical protein
MLHTASGRRNLKLFIAGVALQGVAAGIFEPTFNNYVNDVFALGADARGLLEFPRELPGFLTALLAGVLFFVAETRIAAFCALATGAGMIGLAWLGGTWHPMLICLTLWSIGVHLMMPIRSSLSMALAGESAKGQLMGRISSYSIAASIAGCAFVWLAMKYAGATYRLVFTVGGLAAAAGVVFFLGMRMPGAHLDRPKFVWHRSYWLYYVLQLLYGARKQIFITFGPWVLIKFFHQPAYIFAQLWIAASLLGIVFQPALGRAIDRLGERTIMIAEATLIIFVCLGYGFSDHVPVRTAALWLLYVCFVGDQLLFGANMARDIYLSKIAVRPEHIAPTLSLGITINHIVSMSLPLAGGMLWMAYGHTAVFIAATAIAVVMLGFSLLVPSKKYLDLIIGQRP